MASEREARLEAALLETACGIDKYDGLPCWCPSPTLAAFNRKHPDWDGGKYPETHGHQPFCGRMRAALAAPPPEPPGCSHHGPGCPDPQPYPPSAPPPVTPGPPIPAGHTRESLFRERHCGECLRDPKPCCGTTRNIGHRAGCTHVCTHSYQAFAPPPPVMPGSLAGCGGAMGDGHAGCCEPGCIDCNPPPTPVTPGVCGSTSHPVFTYPCLLPRGHAGPHDNGSGDPWEGP